MREEPSWDRRDDLGDAEILRHGVHSTHVILCNPNVRTETKAGLGYIGRGCQRSKKAVVSFH